MAKSQSKEIEEIKRKLQIKKTVDGPDYANGLSTGSTLLNMAYTGRPDVGYLPGTYYYLVGSSNSGKSFLTLVAMAEAALNEAYKDYRFIFDDPEEGVQMDLARFFGKDMANRVEPASVVSGKPCHSTTIEEFYVNLDDALNTGPCIYVLDSMDALSSLSEEKYFTKIKKSIKKDKSDDDEKLKGSFGDGKAKVNSSLIRQMLHKISDTGSILIIISQAKDKVGEIFSWEKETHSGGRSLDYYAQVQTWTSIKGKINKLVNEKNRHIGNECQFHVKRSRYTGRQEKVDIPIYFSHGVDDVGSCVDYLLDESHWKKEKNSILAPEFDFKGTRDKLISMIESTNQENKLQGIVAQVWMDIEEAMSINRKKKYN
jgi:RecA/RadA recombinase